MDECPPGCVIVPTPFASGCDRCALYDKLRHRAKPECGNYNCIPSTREDGYFVIFVNKEEHDAQKA